MRGNIATLKYLENKGNKIDIFVGSKAEAIKLGTLQGRKLKVWHMTQEGEENEIQEETSRN